MRALRGTTRTGVRLCKRSSGTLGHSDQIVHFLNLICWAALAVSGIALGSAARASLRPERLDVSVHFIAGFALIIVIAAWLVFSPARARRFVHEILRTDRPFLAWLRNLGGYPTKLLRFLRLTKAEPSTAPQGRYNAGQRIAYALLVLLNLTLIGTGVLLFILHQPHEQSRFYQGTLAAHSFTFKAGVLILLAHIPMGLLSRTTQGDPAWLGRTHSRRDGRKARPALVPRGPRAPCGRPRPSRRAQALRSPNARRARFLLKPRPLLSSPEILERVPSVLTLDGPAVLHECSRRDSSEDRSRREHVAHEGVFAVNAARNVARGRKSLHGSAPAVDHLAFSLISRPP